jgi:DNA-directed RNA polymerase subunit beta'
MNSIYMMSHSGARGSPQQMKQLAGMRGLMARPDGSIIETPILSNFKEGLTVLEYFNSTHGARKGLADTALKTANSGYLTRRLVDVANDCIITAEDCGTKNGVTVQAEIDGGQVVASLAERILGRTSAEDIKHPDTGDVIVKRGRELTEDISDKIEAAHIQKVRVRSVLACELSDGVCGKCYGRDLARGTSVNIGEAVGVIAAQSIGEPGTQLTMRTFHIGGAAQFAGQSKIEASYDGKIKIVNRNIVKNSDGEMIAMGRNMQITIVDPKGAERASYRITYGARIKMDDGATVKRGDRLAEWNPNAIPVLTEVEGTVRYEELVSGISLKEVADEKTGVSNKVVMDSRGSGSRGNELRPTIVIVDKSNKPIKLPAGGEARYGLTVDAILSVEDGATVRAGDVLARLPTEGAKTRDITGGLPRVAELFDARKP